MTHVAALQENWSLEEVIEVIQMSTKQYDINVTYPEYLLSGQFLNTFNTVISAEITGYVEQFIEAAGQLPLPDGLKSELKGRHFTYTAMRQFITVKMDLYPYLGGAHPNHDIVTVTFDSSANTIITLSDFLGAGSNYLKRLSTLVEKALFEKYPELQFAFKDPAFRQGFAPKEENFSYWTLTDDGLIIFFPEYQIAPYAAGTLDVIIPFADIRG